MSVLVNGIPTKEFVVGRGLRQGDPISPFLFVLAAEGLTRSARRTKELGEFSCFNVKSSCKVYFLQFADDTLMVENGGSPFSKSRFQFVRRLRKSKAILCGEDWKTKGVFIGFGGRKFVRRSLRVAWKDILRARYNGFLSVIFTGAGASGRGPKFSSWWKDLVVLERKNCPENQSLKELFLAMFASSSYKYATVAEMGGFSLNRWFWGDLGLEGLLSTKFRAYQYALRAVLDQVSPIAKVADSVFWRPNGLK
ncbi:uncharacterized protein LOC131605138 [Vicia villosa]|uniref:uncharacterized protein LOC131605138 n=1 Tax=Vicia villosa TaxID=3911 RepID=UPI00273AE94C|nr:uncharacterized protein LOC131605138 [Vicia villosa]